MTDQVGSGTTGRALEGVLLMVFTCACFAGMSAAIRHISAEVSVYQIAFFRNAIGTLVLVPFMARVGFGTLGLHRFRLFAVRAAIGIIAMLAWYSALQMTPLAEAITLNFTVSLWMIPVAIIMLGERVGPRRWIATLVGFVGVLIVLRPGADTFTIGGVLAILSALLFCISMALVRLLSRAESPLAIVFYMNVIMTPLSLGPAIWFWETPTPEQIGWLCGIGIVLTMAHFSMARALSIMETTAIVPLDFTRLPFAVLIGWLAFDEFPGPWTWAGAAVIIASAIYITHREATLRRRARAMPSGR
jgi:drug/metabolite transporter (DMT)-like permease